MLAVFVLLFMLYNMIFNVHETRSALHIAHIVPTLKDFGLASDKELEKKSLQRTQGTCCRYQLVLIVGNYIFLEEIQHILLS